MKTDYLDPRWQKFRLLRLQMADWRCESCCSSDEKLNVHHIFYVPGRKPWDYLPETTSVLCDECHEAAHDGADSFKLYGVDHWEESAARVLASQYPDSYFQDK
jgi:hypothetical protein